MVTKSNDPLSLPALRGRIGNWVYYSCLIPIAELAKRVDYAQDIHTDKQLSRLIQRSLEGKRSSQIAAYLEKTDERFFNSLVLATYEGHPEWLEVRSVQPQTEHAASADIDQGITDTLGFLSLSGSERIFAVDGQHRLAGIKRAIENGLKFDGERLPVIFVAHIKSKQERTRRLFTTLNKSAKPVKKSDIIALDEDDTMAITARRLVETNDWFTSPKILVEARDAIPRSNTVALTTLGNLYDILKLVFKFATGKARDDGLRFNRPSDRKLDEYYSFAISYFEALAMAFPAVGELFETDEPEFITAQHRGEFGGHVLFRPAGITAFTKTAIAFAKHHKIGLPDAVLSLSVLPTDLRAKPYAGVLWDTDRNKMISSGARLTTELLAYMAGLPVNRAKLRESYTRALGSDELVRMPTRLLRG